MFFLNVLFESDIHVNLVCMWDTGLHVIFLIECRINAASNTRTSSGSASVVVPHLL